MTPRPLLPGQGASAAERDAARAACDAHPLVGGSLLSADGGTTLLILRLAGGALTVKAIEPVVTDVHALAAWIAETPGVGARVTGIPVFRVEIFNRIRSEQRLFMGVGATICFFIGWFFFRSLRACIATTVPPILGSFWVLGGIGLFGGEIDILGTILPVLCILIAFTDSMHLMIDMRRERAAGRNPVAAAQHAITTLGLPCLLPSSLSARFLREDLKRAVVIARVADLETDEMRPLIDGLECELHEVARRHPGTSIHLTGTDVVARRTVNRMIVDLARGLAIAALIIFGVIALEFRSLRLGLISLLPNVFPLALVGAILAWSGRPLQMVSAVVFTVLLGLAVDDTIHFLARYRIELAAGDGTRAALRRSFLKVGTAVGMTTVVLVVGNAAVLASEVPTNRLFAGLISIGLAAALIGDLIFLPALLACFRGPDQP